MKFQAAVPNPTDMKEKRIVYFVSLKKKMEKILLKILRSEHKNQQQGTKNRSQ